MIGIMKNRPGPSSRPKCAQSQDHHPLPLICHLDRKRDPEGDDKGDDRNRDTDSVDCATRQGIGESCANGKDHDEEQSGERATLAHLTTSMLSVLECVDGDVFHMLEFVNQNPIARCLVRNRSGCHDMPG